MEARKQVGSLIFRRVQRPQRRERRPPEESSGPFRFGARVGDSGRSAMNRLLVPDLAGRVDEADRERLGRDRDRDEAVHGLGVAGAGIR